MKLKRNLIIGLIIGLIFIILAIIIGVITENDIGFVFAGIGTIIIGFSILLFINKNNKNILPKQKENINIKNEQENDNK